MQGGHAVFRPFTFTANGTNNQIISVVFQLKDGPRDLQTVVFSFILGTSTATFASPGVIFVPDTNSGRPPPWARPVRIHPYQCSGLQGAVGKVTVTISNLTHHLPSDIMMLWFPPPPISC